MEEESRRNAERIGTLLDSFVLNPGIPEMAVTPKTAIWRRGKTRLYRYVPQQELYPVPLLIAPWLGISRSTILDMLPGNSMVEFLVSQGFDTYLLDWGDIAEEDRALGWETAIGKIIPGAIQAALDASNAEELTLAGLCLGGTMTISYAALTQDPRLRNLITIVAPFDFSQGGLFETWLGRKGFPIDVLVERYGGIPSTMMGSAFKMLRPTMDLRAMTNLWLNLDRKAYITSYKAMCHWASDYVGLPGAFASKLIKELYGQNQLLKGQFRVDGQVVDLKRITQPLITAAAAQDYIAPAPACRPLIDLVSSQEKKYIELPGGHISVFSGREARTTLWPELRDWLAPRSQGSPKVSGPKGAK